jgi:hypothetical protein
MAKLQSNRSVDFPVVRHSGYVQLPWADCLCLIDDWHLLQQIAAWKQSPQVIGVAVMASVGSVPAVLSADVLPKRSRAAQLNEAASRVARECRNGIQGCLREEEWLDVDREFHWVFLRGMKSVCRWR